MLEFYPSYSDLSFWKSAFFSFRISFEVFSPVHTVLEPWPFVYSAQVTGSEFGSDYLDDEHVETFSVEELAKEIAAPSGILSGEGTVELAKASAEKCESAR